MAKRGTERFGKPTKASRKKSTGDSKKGSGGYPVSHSRDPLGWRDRTPKPERDPLGHSRRST
jgi:hypothetical protein